MARYVERYVASDWVEHGCCYAASVMDMYTTYSGGSPDVVCECCDVKMAEKIAALLNLAASTAA